MISADVLQLGPNTLILRPPSLIESPSLSTPLGTELLQLHNSISRKDLNFSLFDEKRVARDEVILDHADGTSQAIRYKMKKPMVFRGENGEVTGRMSTGDEMIYAFDSQGKMTWIRLTSHEDPQKIYHFQVTDGQVEIARFDRANQTTSFDIKPSDLDPLIVGKITNFNRHLTERVKFCKTRRGLVLGLAAGGGVLTLGAGAALLLGQKPETTGVIPSPTTTVVPSRVTQTSPARSTQPPVKEPEPTATKKVDRKDILRNAEEEITRLEKETIGESAFFAQNSAGETIAVNADVPFEAWSLIKVPFTVLILKDIRSNPQKYDLKDPVEINGFVYTSLTPSIDSPFIYAIYEMLRFSNNDVFEYMVKQYAGENDWGTACKIVTRRLQSELDLTSTNYDSDLNIFQSTARESRQGSTTYI